MESFYQAWQKESGAEPLKMFTSAPLDCKKTLAKKWGGGFSLSVHFTSQVLLHFKVHLTEMIKFFTFLTNDMT